ncbi:MAG: CDP-alcohol phosphatidyltransferase family protein [Candidatus Binatia bacterium]
MSVSLDRIVIVGLLVSPLVYVVVGVIVYAVRAMLGNAPVDAELARRGHSALLGSTVRQGFAWAAGPLERLFAAGGASPDTLTMAGFAMCCLGAFTIGAGDLTVGGLLVLGSSGFDFLDGRVARRRGVANRGGEFLDSTLDRFSDALCFGAAAFLFRDSPWNLTAALVAFGAAGIVPYARAKAEALGSDLRSGLMQRPERLVLYSAASILSAPLDGLWPASLQGSYPTFAAMTWFIALATAATAIARTREGLRLIRSAKGSDPNQRGI